MGMPPEINFRVAERDLKYYIFDWDDNILHMPTRIHLERRDENGHWRPHLVSTAAFSVIRNDRRNYRPPGNDWENAFVEFQDFDDQEENVFLRHTREAIRTALNDPAAAAPSFQTFRRALVEGRIFAIVTARGHHSSTLRKGVETFLDEVLTAEERTAMLSNLRGYIACFDRKTDALDDREVLDYYLGLNRYHAVTSPQFRDRFAPPTSPGTDSFETRKQFAVRDFVEHVIRIVSERGLRRPLSVGFSDDDPANIEAVQRFIRTELSRSFPSIRFVVYDTSDPELEKGRKIVVSGQLDLGLPDSV